MKAFLTKLSVFDSRTSRVCHRNVALVLKAFVLRLEAWHLTFLAFPPGDLCKVCGKETIVGLVRTNISVEP